MRVLQLFSNKRWTGPAEPAANLAAALHAAGVDVTFACAAEGDRDPHRLADEARARGLHVRTDLHLPKHFQPLAVMRDSAVLARELRAGKYDLLHCHQRVDHCTAGLARRWARTPVPIVRSVYDGVRLNGSRLDALAVRRWTDALCVPSQQTRDDVAARGLLPADRLHIVDGAVNTKRFNPERAPADARAEWRLTPEHVVFGVVARMQPYRRFDVLLRAFRQAAEAAPAARLVIVGRGSREEEVARRPVRQMGLSDRVHFAGYLTGDAYVAALAAMDALIFLVPGSDGTCRTVREALAMGVPVIASGRGILPWLVEDGRTGLVVEDGVDPLAAAIVRLTAEKQTLARLQANARRTGPERFALERQADAMRAVYAAVVHG